MSDKPQNSELGSPEIDTLNEIMDRAMPNIPDPPEEELFDTQDTPIEAHAKPSDVSRETFGADETMSEKPAAPPPGTSKRSSVYVYLAVLFGAAFLMLLLAYFVQQRNNATVQNELRSTTASRQELLEDIQRLEAENETLQQDKNVLDLRLEQVKEEKDKAVQAHELALRFENDIMARAEKDNLLNLLERFNDAGDWLMSGALIQRYDFYFNEHNKDFVSDNLFPSQTARYLELREEVFDKAGCMVMENFTTEEDWSKYTERPYIGENIFEKEDLEAARAFLTVLELYPSVPSTTAWQFAELFQPGSENLERLTGSEAFKPFTVELFEQVRTDLIDQYFLGENADGTIITANHPYYVEYGGILEE